MAQSKKSPFSKELREQLTPLADLIMMKTVTMKVLGEYLNDHKGGPERRHWVQRHMALLLEEANAHIQQLSDLIDPLLPENISPTDAQFIIKMMNLVMDKDPETLKGLLDNNA